MYSVVRAVHATGFFFCCPGTVFFFLLCGVKQNECVIWDGDPQSRKSVQAQLRAADVRSSGALFMRATSPLHHILCLQSVCVSFSLSVLLALHLCGCSKSPPAQQGNLIHNPDVYHPLRSRHAPKEPSLGKRRLMFNNSMFVIFSTCHYNHT